MKNKRIALFMISPLTQGGGAEKYFINFAKNLNVKENIEADVITFDDKSFRRFTRLLHIFTRGNFFWKIDNFKKGMREKKEDIKRELGEACWLESPRIKIRKILKNYDLIYAKNEIADLFVLKFIGYKKLPPIIVGVHTPIFYPQTKSFFSKLHNFLYAGFFYKYLLRGSKCIHVSNIFTKNIVEKKFKTESRLVYYPFSTKVIADLKKKYKCEIKFEKEKINIIFAGRMGEQKGIDILVSLIEKIGENENIAKKVQVNIFGSGDKKHENAVKELSKKFSFVCYFGHIENKFIPDILSRQNLMVAPSRWETLPYSILEAQAAGVPVFAFDIPGPNDIIENGKTGILVKNEEDFFRSVKNFIEGKIIFSKKNIIQNIEEKFHSDRIYNQLFSMLSEYL